MGKGRAGRIVFFFPYVGFGGVPIIFARMANFLSQHFSIDRKIAIVDYQDGCLWEHSTYSEVEKIDYDGAPIELGCEDVLILQAMPLWMFPDRLNLSKETKIVFWNMHPLNLLPFLQATEKFKLSFVDGLLIRVGKHIFMRREAATARLFQRHRALCFMDRPNYEFIARMAMLESPTFVPLPKYVGEASRASVIPLNGLVKAVWVGRLCNFKVFILQHAIERLARAAIELELDFEFTVIGSGPLEYQLKLRVRPWLENIKFCDDIRQDNMGLLAKNFHLGVAMGSAALDMSAAGLPTLAVDFSYRPIVRDYHFKWIYQREAYDLGDKISSSDYDVNQDSMVIRISELISSQPSISLECSASVKRNHDITHVANLFIELVNNCSLKFGDIPEIYFKRAMTAFLLGARKGWAQRI